MNASRGVHGLLVALCVSLLAVPAFGQAAAQEPAGQVFQPQVGQAGKDVVWVPTPQALVDKMLDLAQLTPQDVLIDLGSGDGRTVITAAKRGARAMGIEYNPDMVALSQANAEKEGVSAKATFMKADLFETDLSQATVITMFLLPQINLKLRPKILDLKPGTRIVSNSFEMGEWAADDRAVIQDGCTSWCTALLWIVPAKVDGGWRLGKGQLTLRQEFQVVSGSLDNGGTSTPITDGKLHSADITFRVGDAQYAGHVNGNTIEGTVKDGNGETKFAATKVG